MYALFQNTEEEEEEEEEEDESTRRGGTGHVTLPWNSNLFLHNVFSIFYFCQLGLMILCHVRFCWLLLDETVPSQFKKKLIFMPFGRDWDIWRRIMWLWDQEDQAFVGPFIAQPYKLQNERWVRDKLCSEGLLWAIPSMDCSPKISPLI